MNHYIYPYYPLPYIPMMLVPAYSPLNSTNTRPFPQVTTKKLKASATTFEALLIDASTINKAFLESNSFAIEVMKAARDSNKEKVTNLLENLDITHPITVDYNPDGIHVTLSNLNDEECSKLAIMLHW